MPLLGGMGEFRFARHDGHCTYVAFYLKQERCSQRQIRAAVLDELVWEEVSSRLQASSVGSRSRSQFGPRQISPNGSFLPSAEVRLERQFCSNLYLSSTGRAVVLANLRG
jgi:hypothetical protein